MKLNTDQLLGVGLYSPAEAAHYARVATQMMTRWVHGSRQGEPVVHAKFRESDEKIVTFVDFVQSVAVRQLRRQNPPPSLQKIRAAYEEAVSRYNVEYPFAYRHESFYDGKNIWINLPWARSGRDQLFTQMTGRGRGQSMIREVAQMYINRITFAEGNGLATRFTLYHDELGEVTMDPAQRFGEPFLPCGLTLSTVLDAHQTCGNANAVAEMYEIKPEEVILALRCDDFLDLRAAA